MNKIIIVLILVAINYSLAAQKNRSILKENNCEEYSQMVDSVYVYDWNKTINKWILNTIWQYNNTDGKQDRLLFIRANNREPIRAWDYYYDANGNRNYEVSTYWRNNNWVLNQKIESEFSEDNKKINQLNSLWRNESWVFSSYYYTEYSEDGKLIRINYQSMDMDGSLYDRSYSLYAYENERLIEVKGFSALDGSMTGINKYFYDHNDLLSEFLIIIPKISDTNSIDFVPSKRRLYYYDNFSLLREVLFQGWNESEWQTTSKYVYYRKIDNARKVSVCHNGQTLCISVNALPAHLAHGDKLGKCSVENQPGKRKSAKVESEINKSNSLSFYPNPAIDRIEIKFPDNLSHEITRIDVVDFYGKMLRTYNVRGINEFTVYREDLKSGNYFIRLTSAKETFSGIVIFE